LTEIFGDIFKEAQQMDTAFAEEIGEQERVSLTDS
jgi:hypothetical protein